jgi:hypothetical protein
MVLFSSLMAASISPCGRAIVPVPAAPVVTPTPVFVPEPEDCAVPALLVPGGGAAGLDELPALPESAPALCANALTGEIRIAIAATAAVMDDRFIGHLPLPFNDAIKSWFPAE